MEVAGLSQVSASAYVKIKCCENTLEKGTLSLQVQTQSVSANVLEIFLNKELSKPV